MPAANKVQKQIQQFVKEVKACEAFVLKSFKKFDSKSNKRDVNNYEKQAAERRDHLKMVFMKLGQKAYSLEDVVASNNYLMEYKRKDLLVQTYSLQDALDE